MSSHRQDIPGAEIISVDPIARAKAESAVNHALVVMQKLGALERQVSDLTRALDSLRICIEDRASQRMLALPPMSEPTKKALVRRIDRLIDAVLECPPEDMSDELQAALTECKVTDEERKAISDDD